MKAEYKADNDHSLSMTPWEQLIAPAAYANACQSELKIDAVAYSQVEPRFLSGDRPFGQLLKDGRHRANKYRN